MSILYVTANPKKTKDSFGLRLGAHFIKECKVAFPEAEITSLDLFKGEIPFLHEDQLQMWERGGDVSVGTVSNQYVEQFLTHDLIVIVTPLWNMSFPPQVKAYIDQLIIPGQTFRFSDKGIEGTAKNQRIVHIQARGGTYSASPMKEFENGDRYLRTIFKLIGVKQYDHLYIEGTSGPQEASEKNLQAACERAESLVAKIKEDVFG